jgi:DNA polymerase-1
VDHKVADDLRKAAKNVNFGAQNNARAPKLSETLVMPLADAQLFLDARSAMFPGVEVASDAAANKAKNIGYAETLMGARRHLQSAVTSAENNEVERAARQAWNHEIQGSASEMTKLGMKRIWLSDAPWKYDFRFVAPIHDEITFTVHRDHAAECIKIVHDCMVVPYANMDVPILASISLGNDFANQIECGDWFIEENVRDALERCKESRSQC